ncbi:MAG TPA: hypothetical protein DCZ44_05600 [Flavobacteriaceae bacterium]|nr:hypothetical protein [Flavobacteriaceae bacterium]
MENIIDLLQLIVALSVLYIWAFRFKTINQEFEQFGYSEQFKAITGVSKVILATFLISGLISGVLCGPFTVIGALGMAAFMAGAQYAHMSVKNPWSKRLPSLIFLLMCLTILAQAYGVI